MSTRLALFLAVTLSFFGVSLQAQSDSVAALAGTNSLGTSVSIFRADSPTSPATFTAGPGNFIVLAKPDGSKYYIVSKSSNNSIMSVGSDFAAPKLVANLDVQPTDAAISPDGSRLVVAAGNLHVYNTANDQDMVQGGINTHYAINHVALSFDGKIAYTLGISASGGSQVNIIDLTNNTISPPQANPAGTANSITVGLNGRVYVGAPNVLYEYNPATLQQTGTIAILGNPGKPVFTPDGKWGLVPNLQAASNQDLVTLIDMATFTKKGSKTVNDLPNTVIDTLLVESNTAVLAYSTQSQQLAQLGIGSAGNSFTIGAPQLGGQNVSFVRGVALSNEVAFLPGSGPGTIAHYVFVATADTLFKVDLTTNTAVAQTPLSQLQIGALEYIALPSTQAPVAMLLYGDLQTVAPNAKSLPLVVRVVDQFGKPVSGATVTFAASPNTATLSPTSAVTQTNGIATTILTAPPTNGRVSVVVNVGNLQQRAFTITVGTATAPNAGNLTITAGQGQLVASQVNSGAPGFGSPLTVLLTDLNNNPIKAAPVVFSITSGNGSLFGTSSKTLTVNTGTDGQASASFESPLILGNLPDQTTITASAKAAGNGTVTFIETTDPGPTVDYTTAPQPGKVFRGQAGTVIKNAFSAAVSGFLGANLQYVSVRTCLPTVNNDETVTCDVPDATVPFATCADPTGSGGPVSDAKGRINCDLVLNGVVGTGRVGFQIGYSKTRVVTYQLIIDPGPPSLFNIIQGDQQTGKPGDTLPLALVARLVDQFGNLLPNLSGVTWQVVSGSATLVNPSSGTDGAGNTSTLVKLGDAAGTVVVEAKAGTATASFTLNVLNPAAGLQPVSGDGQITTVNTGFTAPLIVKVVDGSGKGVNGATVTFSVNGGSASVGSASTLTDTNGQASTTVSAGATPGNIVIVATSGNFSLSFNLSSHLLGPQNILIVNGANFKLQPECQKPGCFAPGEVVTITGSGFATGITGVVSGLTILGPLQTTLAGVSVTFNGVPAPIYYVANVNGVESMTVQVPFETQPGPVNVVLNAAGGGESATIIAQAQLYAPGVFTSTYGNQTVAVAVRPDGSYVSPSNPAHPGETIFVFATGLGQTSPPANTNQQGAGQAVTARVITGINNAGVPHTQVEYAPGLVGVYLVGIQIPENTKTGDHQPIGLLLADSSGRLYRCLATFIPIH